MRHAATHCNTLQHTSLDSPHKAVNEARCNTLQHAATHVSWLAPQSSQWGTLQHTATRCNTRLLTRPSLFLESGPHLIWASLETRLIDGFCTKSLIGNMQLASLRRVTRDSMGRDSIGNGVRHWWHWGNAILAIWQGIVGNEAMDCWQYGKEMLAMRRYFVGKRELNALMNCYGDMIHTTFRGVTRYI